MKLVLGMEVGLSPGDFVLDGEPTPFQKGAEPPTQFKTPLGTEVDLGPGHIVY